MSVPPLPKIETNFDLFLDVHTHKSLQTNQTLNDQWGNTDRLAELGSKVLEMAVTHHFFSLRPCIDPDEIRMRTEQYTSFDTIEGWLEAYRLKQKLRVPPTESDSILSNQREMVAFFNTYVGAVYYVSGFDAVQHWISRLIDPNAQVNVPHAFQDGQHTSGYQTQSQASSSDYHMRYSPAPPAGPPPPIPASPSPSATMSSSSSALPSPMNLVTLALVNQTATKNGLDINYIATQNGPSHQPTWTVRCTINGVERGIGIAKSQKLAKEEAARRTWLAMRW